MGFPLNMIRVVCVSALFSVSLNLSDCGGRSITSGAWCVPGNASAQILRRGKEASLVERALEGFCGQAAPGGGGGTRGMGTIAVGRPRALLAVVGVEAP